MDRDDRNLDPRDDRLDERLDAAREVREDEARLTLSEEQLAIGKRERVAGEVEVGKTVETRHVSESVPAMHEEVTLERRPLEPGMHAEGTIGEERLSVPVRAEEVVAEKRVVPTEELVVHKREVVEERPVEAELRREELDVRPQGDVNLREDPRVDPQR